MVVVEGGRGVAWWGDEAEAGGTTQQTGEAKGEASSSSSSKHSKGCCLCPQRQTPNDAETMGTTSRVWLGRPGQRWRRKRTRRVCVWLVGGGVDVGVVVLVFFVEGLWAGVSLSPSLAH